MSSRKPTIAAVTVCSLAVTMAGCHAGGTPASPVTTASSSPSSLPATPRESAGGTTPSASRSREDFSRAGLHSIVRSAAAGCYFTLPSEPEHFLDLETEVPNGTLTVRVDGTENTVVIKDGSAAYSKDLAGWVIIPSPDMEPNMAMKATSGTARTVSCHYASADGRVSLTSGSTGH